MGLNGPRYIVMGLQEACNSRMASMTCPNIIKFNFTVKLYEEKVFCLLIHSINLEKSY